MITRRSIFSALVGLPALLFGVKKTEAVPVLDLSYPPRMIDIHAGKDNEYPWMFASNRPVDADIMTDVYNKYGHRVGMMLSSCHDCITGRMRAEVIAQSSPELLVKHRAHWALSERMHPGSSDAERAAYVASLEDKQGAHRSSSTS
jgi:hypothetical protein